MYLIRMTVHVADGIQWEIKTHYEKKELARPFEIEEVTATHLEIRASCGPQDFARLGQAMSRFSGIPLVSLWAGIDGRMSLAADILEAFIECLPIDTYIEPVIVDSIHPHRWGNTHKPELYMVLWRSCDNSKNGLTYVNTQLRTSIGGTSIPEKLNVSFWKQMPPFVDEHDPAHDDALDGNGEVIYQDLEEIIDTE